MKNIPLSKIEHGCSTFYTDENETIKPNFVLDAYDDLVFLNNTNIEESGFNNSAVKISIDESNSFPWTYSEKDFYTDLKHTIESIAPEFREQYRICYPGYRPKKFDWICFPVVKNNHYSNEEIISIIETMYKENISVDLKKNVIKSLAIIGVHKVLRLKHFNNYYHTTQPNEAHNVINDSWVRNNITLIKKLKLNEE